MTGHDDCKVKPRKERLNSFADFSCALEQSYNARDKNPRSFMMSNRLLLKTCHCAERKLKHSIVPEWRQMDNKNFGVGQRIQPTILTFALVI